MEHGAQCDMPVSQVGKDVESVHVGTMTRSWRGFPEPRTNCTAAHECAVCYSAYSIRVIEVSLLLQSHSTLLIAGNRMCTLAQQ